MDVTALEQLLAAHRAGDLETSEAVSHIQNLHYEDIGYARIDHARSARQGFPEVVFGAGKTRERSGKGESAGAALGRVLFREPEGVNGEIGSAKTKEKKTNEEPGQRGRSEIEDFSERERNEDRHQREEKS